MHKKCAEHDGVTFLENAMGGIINSVSDNIP